MSTSCPLPQIRFCGVNRSNGHNTGLEEAQVERGKDDIQTSSLSLEPEDTLNTMDSSGVTRLLEGMNRGYNGLTTPLFGFNPRILEYEFDFLGFAFFKKQI
ncbi:hypothetical protein KEM48_007104 [Puccinia striiformis f. sp. tritici PST-130]|nr:hypothetical protein KEM48_007104 [Puccinia striiformis f. sp. tritici PST-130]